jgi:hypothetical protein
MVVRQQTRTADYLAVFPQGNRLPISNLITSKSQSKQQV